MTRPKIRIKLTSADKAVELIGWFALLTIWIIVITNYSNLPETIPIHYNAVGKADGFGNKINILLLPLVASILFAGMTTANKFPHIFNYPVKITGENAFRQYTNATMMMRFLKLILVVIFGLIAFKTINSASGYTSVPVIWFLPFSLCLIFIPLTYFIIKSFREK